MTGLSGRGCPPASRRISFGRMGQIQERDGKNSAPLLLLRMASIGKMLNEFISNHMKAIVKRTGRRYNGNISHWEYFKGG